jgi:hypothetical protein
MLDVAVPALLAGTVAVAITLAIERFGGRVGGLLGTLPSTIVPAAWGIFQASDNNAAFVIAMLGVPVGMLLNGGFLFCWRVLPPRLPAASLGGRLALTLALSLGAWSIAAAAVVVGVDQLPADVGTRVPIGIGATVALAAIGVLATRRAPPSPRGRRGVGPLTLVLRGSGAALAVGVAVVIAHAGAPLLAGIASVFPAIFLTTMVALWLAQGEAVPVGAVGPMMLGSSSVSVFALLAALTFPSVGAGAGMVLSWIGAALLATVPASWWVVRRLG